MTFWDGETVPFDPTVASPAELLGDWKAAIQSMTKDQGIERIFCMLTRDREAVLKTMERNPENGLMRCSHLSFAQDETMHMVDRWNARWCKSEMYEIFTSNGSYFVARESEIYLLVMHPSLFDDGTPDWIPTPRTSCWVSVWFSRNQNQNEICIYNNDFIDYIVPIDHVGRRVLDPNKLTQIAIELSNKLNIPILPQPLGGDYHSKLLYFDWSDDSLLIPLVSGSKLDVDENQRNSVRWLKSMMPKLDLLDPTWRERVLSNARDGIHPALWPRVKP